MRRLGVVLAAGAVWLFLLAIPALADNGPHVMGANSTALLGSCASCHRAHSGQAPMLLRATMPALCYACHGSANAGATTDVQDGIAFAAATTTHGTGAQGIQAGALRGGGFSYALIQSNPPATVLTGTVAKTAGSPTLVGTGTSFTTQAPAGSVITIAGGGMGAYGPVGVEAFSVTLVTDDTHLTLSGNAVYTTSGTTATVGGLTDDANRTIGVLTTGILATSSHSVDGTPVTMWGAGALGVGNNGKTNVALTCVSCHDPHGNGQYRILRPGPDDSYAIDAAGGFVKINDGTTHAYTTTNYGVLGLMAADTAAESPLNADLSAINYDTSTKTYSGTFFEASSRWCATCHTRYFAPTGSAGNKSYTATGRGDNTYKFSHAIRNLVDPLTNGAPTTGVITPINAGSQIKVGSTLGSLTSSGTNPYPYSYVNRGVAVLGTADGVNSGGVAGELLTTHAPPCITCHVAHGTDSALGSFITSSGQTSLVTGTLLDTALLRLDGRGACQNCHRK